MRTRWDHTRSTVLGGAEALESLQTAIDDQITQLDVVGQ